MTDEFTQHCIPNVEHNQGFSRTDTDTNPKPYPLMRAPGPLRSSNGESAVGAPWPTKSISRIDHKNSKNLKTAESSPKSAARPRSSMMTLGVAMTTSYGGKESQG